MTRQTQHGALVETQRPVACCALIAFLAVALAVGVLLLGWPSLKDLSWPPGAEAIPGADRMVRISLDGSDATPDEVASWFAGQAVLESVAAWRPVSVTLSRGEDVAPSLRSAQVSAEFFDAVEVQPLLGRTLAAGDFATGDAMVVNYWVWQGWLGGDAATIGSTLALGEAGEEEVVVVGVMPEGFSFPNGSQFWLPLVRERGGGVEIFGKLRPGTSVEMAQAELERVLARNLPDGSYAEARSLRVESMFDD